MESEYGLYFLVEKNTHEDCHLSCNVMAYVPPLTVGHCCCETSCVQNQHSASYTVTKMSLFYINSYMGRLSPQELEFCSNININLANVRGKVVRD